MKKAIIIGAGGTSHHILPLIQMMDQTHSIEIWDGDSFEESNISRQFLALNNLGKNKAEAMAEYYSGITGKKITAVPNYFYRDALRMMRNTVIINLSDNHRCRRESRNWCMDTENILFCSAAEVDFGNAFIWHPSFQSTESDPFVRYPELETQDGDDPIRREGGCGSINSSPQSSAANFMSAAMMLMIVRNWLFEPCVDINNNIGEIQFVKNKISSVTIGSYGQPL